MEVLFLFYLGEIKPLTVPLPFLIDNNFENHCFSQQYHNFSMKWLRYFHLYFHLNSERSINESFILSQQHLLFSDIIEEYSSNIEYNEVSDFYLSRRTYL